MWTRFLLPLGILLSLSGCEESTIEPDWKPRQMPEEAIKALQEELGEETTFFVSYPTRQTNALGWICGLATVEGGDKRFFVFDKRSGDMLVSPRSHDDMTQSEAFAVLSFMEYKKPCDARD